MRNPYLLILAMVLLFLPAPADSCSVNDYLMNGTFEQDLLYWRSAGNTSIIEGSTEIEGNYFGVPEGSKMAALTYSQCIGFSSIKQLFRIGPDDASLSFSFNFWSYADTSDPGFIVDINGQSVFSMSPGEFGPNNGGAFDSSGWISVVIPLSEFQDEDYLQLSFISSYCQSGVFLDDIQVNMVPIPSSLVLLVSGLFGLIGIRRRGRP